MLDLLLTIQYVFLLVFNLITSKVNLSYFDELLFLLLLFVSIVITIKNKKIMMSRTFICIAKYFLVILFIGLLSNICFNYCNNTIIIIKDIIINFKFIFTYLLGTYIFCNYKSKRLYRNILSISKIYLIIIFIFGIISMFANIGMGSDLRFGFRSYKFLYSHYTFLVFNVIILLSVISTSKKCLFYDIIGIVILIMTLRTKALMFATGYIFMKFATRKFNSNPIRKKINFKIIFPILLLIILVASPKIKQYIKWGSDYNLRNGLYIKGIEIALDHFPLGAGFGTYATNLSYFTNSPVYEEYGLMSYQGFNDNMAVVSDVYWPSIYGQFGIIGFVLFVIIYLLFIKNILSTQNNMLRNAQIYICLYLFIASIAEAIFTNDTGVFAAIFLVLIGCFDNNEEGYV